MGPPMPRTRSRPATPSGRSAWGSELSTGPYPGTRGTAGWVAYSEDYLSEVSRQPRYVRERVNPRNPELSTQLDSMSDSLDRVKVAANALQKATGMMPAPMILRKDLEIELQDRGTQLASLHLTVQALVQSLAGLGASAFNWSAGLGTPRRKSLAELVLQYLCPLVHIDSSLEDLVSDLKVELYRERLDDVVRPGKEWFSLQDGRSPPPGGSSPHKGRFQLRGAVQGSLRAWKDGDEGPEDFEEFLSFGSPALTSEIKTLRSPAFTSPVRASPASQLDGGWWGPQEAARLGLTSGSEAVEATADEQGTDLVAELDVKIVGASGLRAADTLGKSDAYCVCQITGKPNSSFKTEVIKKTLDPTWNHSQALDKVALTDSLYFQVYDYDAGSKADSLGHITLESSQIFPDGFDGEVDLMNDGKGKDAKLKIKIDVLRIGLDSEAVELRAKDEVPDSPSSPVNPMTKKDRKALDKAQEKARKELEQKEKADKKAQEKAQKEMEKQEKKERERLEKEKKAQEKANNKNNKSNKALVASPVHEAAPVEIPAVQSSMLGRNVFEAAKKAPVAGVSPSQTKSISKRSKRGDIKIDILGARHLRDDIGHVNVRCTCDIIGQPEHWVRTQFVESDIDANVCWNLRDMVSGVNMHVDANLEFTVDDQDGNFLGRARLEFWEFFPSSFNGLIPLQENGSNGVLEVKVRVPNADGASDFQS